MLFEKKPAKRSPVPTPSLPLPGESLRDRFMDRCFDLGMLALFPCMLLIFALAAWLERVFKSPPNPLMWLVLFALVAPVCGWKAWRILREWRPLLLGIRGERIVGQMLEELRADGYKVFHDLQQEGYNIDHLLVGPGGVFAVETKTFSMPTGRRAEVTFDGRHLLVDGLAPDRDPVKQAEACADRVKEILKRMTDRDVSVKPVVLFPSWWVNSNPRQDRTWVMNAEGFVKWIKKERRRLEPHDVTLYADRIATIAREG